MLALPSPDAPPAAAPDKPDYRWSPANQRAFLEALAETGSVTQAAAAAAKSPRAAYNLRFRADGAAFRIGWDAAVLVARATLADDLMERALCGQEDVVVRDGDTLTRRRIDNRLGMSLLSRLDRMAETDVTDGTDGALARLVSQDFEAFLDLIEGGGAGSEAALFVAARTPGGEEAAATDERCELGAPEEAQGPAARAAGMSVWLTPLGDAWRTSFPPPPGFDGFERTGFGAPDYERSLTRAEQRAADARARAEVAPLVEAGAAARDAWFGFAPDDSPDCREAADQWDDDEEEESLPRHPGLEPGSSFPCGGHDNEAEEEGECPIEPGMTEESQPLHPGQESSAPTPNCVRPEPVEGLPSSSAPPEEQGRPSTGSARTSEEDSGEAPMPDSVRVEQSRAIPKRPVPYANGRPPDWLLQATGRWLGGRPW